MVKTCKLEYQKPNRYFSKRKLFYKNKLNQECVCIWYLSNPPTTLSFTFYLKIKFSKNKPRLKSSSSWSLHLKPSWLGPNTIQRARLLLSTWYDLDAQALESNRASSKTWLQILCWSYAPTTILIINLSLIKHKIISIITTWVNHHQN